MRPARRLFLHRTLGAALAAPLAGCRLAAGPPPPLPVLTARPALRQIVPAEWPATPVWSYDGEVPGPVLRYRQGERLRILVRNDLPQATTVHWHGIRLPHAMDGVPHLTQPPIAPGGSFLYEFDLPDPGTYWYHPHLRSHEQVARGLYGALIVEEAAPPRVDRELVWVLSDWRLDPDATIREDFDRLFDSSHAGRLGNTVTVNGRFAADAAVTVRAGERLRLRLINAAAARIFALRFPGHAPLVIATDGHAVTPHEAAPVVLGPGMRCDLVLDCLQPPGSRHTVVDEGSARADPAPVIALHYADAPALVRADAGPVALPAARLPEPDTARAVRHVIEIQGGAMGRLREAELAGERLPLQRLAREHGIAWAVNGVAMKDHAAHHRPLLTLARGTHCLLVLRNDTAWPHPMHLHGHTFRVLARNGRPTPHREWRDTVLLEARETVEVAFVADNPGLWMLHCHILDHQQAGLMATLAVR